MRGPIHDPVESEAHASGYSVHHDGFTMESSELCGSCHDVSNPVVGDLAPNHGTQPTAEPVIASGQDGFSASASGSS